MCRVGFACLFRRPCGTLPRVCTALASEAEVLRQRQAAAPTPTAPGGFKRMLTGLFGRKGSEANLADVAAAARASTDAGGACYALWVLLRAPFCVNPTRLPLCHPRRLPHSATR